MSAIELKVCLLGDSGVGKTSISNRFIQDQFSSIEPPTIGAAFQSKDMQVDGRLYKFLIWDTAGQERFRSLAPLYYRGSHAIILVYDITQYKTVEQVKYWVSEIRNHAPREAQVIIAGNKCDMRHEQYVSKEVMDEYAEGIRAIHILTSAKTGENVTEIFKEIVHTVSMRRRHQSPATVQLPDKAGESTHPPSSSRCC